MNNNIDMEELKSLKIGESKNKRFNMVIDPYREFKLDFLVGVLDEKTRTNLINKMIDKAYDIQCEALNIEPDIHLWQFTARHNHFKPLDYRKMVIYLQKKKHDDAVGVELNEVK